jgi:uncharacterized protein YcaQ
VAVQGADRPPYWTVVRLSIWATANTDLVRHRLRVLQVDPETVTLRALLGHLYAMLIDSYSSVWVSTVQVREAIDEGLADPAGIVPKTALRLYRQDEEARKRATWGREPEHVAGNKAAMAMFGGGPLPKRREAGG